MAHDTRPRSGHMGPAGGFGIDRQQRVGRRLARPRPGQSRTNAGREGGGVVWRLTRCAAIEAAEAGIVRINARSRPVARDARAHLAKVTTEELAREQLTTQEAFGRPPPRPLGRVGET